MSQYVAKEERSAFYNAVVGVLFIRTGGKEFGYYLDFLTSEIHQGGERAYRLTPFASQRRDDQPEHYDVVCGASRETSVCECRGFLYHGHCKHVDALIALRERGKLA